VIDFLSFLGIQFVSYFILVGNIRAVSKLHYGAATVTEAAHLLILWFVIRRVIESDSLGALAGYVIGGTLGTLASMYLSRKWKDSPSDEV
jgi:hypothetical protein